MFHEPSTPHISQTILSTVGGFSQPVRQHIRSLQDLLGTIEGLRLKSFNALELQLHAGNNVGEGVSYRVSRCVHAKTEKLYAVKQVKLPAAGSDGGAFQRRVGCVLRDIEVCLAMSLCNSSILLGTRF